MVIFVFWIVVMALTLAALGLLLPPLLRTAAGLGPDRRALERELAALKRRRDAGEIDDAAYATERERVSAALLAAVEAAPPPPARVLAIVLSLALPVAALALYFSLGRPDALDERANAAPADAQDMAEAVAGLEARLRDEPDDVPGWLLLARSYRTMERFDDALRATSSAYALAPQSPDVLVEHAEATTLASPTRRFDEQTRPLLDAALAADPAHQKALWLLGIAELQAERYSQAVTYWERLRAGMDDGPMAARIDEQIAAARARAGDAAPAPARETEVAASADADDGPQLLVTVEIDDAMRERVAAGDVLFVFVRAPGGGPPLAIRRIDAPTFPASIALSQADRMLAGAQMEAGAEVEVVARVSKSGQAQPQTGDLQAEPLRLTLGARSTTALRIDRVVD